MDAERWQRLSPLPDALLDLQPGARAEELERLRAAHPPHGEGFNVKHSPGGMIDVEFAVQYLVLAHARVHPELIGNVGNIALLRRAQAVGLLPPGVGQAAADAYRALRRAQHKARLDESSLRMDAQALHAERQAVLALWQAVFGEKIAG